MTDTPTAAPARSAHQVLERLFQLHPKLFGARFLPLKLGAFEDLMARHPGEFSKDELKAALGFHARSTRYLEAVATQMKRYDLDGQAVEDVAPEHVFHAIMETWRRRQARSKQDLKPWVLERLSRAISASGLDRDAWLERVQPRDDVAFALIQEAFAAQAGAQAKREAMRRAFEASGATPEAFAEMYGLPLSEVRALLQPA
ncbi:MULTISPECIES: ProQ/FINO family protein [Ramlibacter]|uniref:Prop effector n=1 Tax=Ramlibacter aquaticus TaxID=2780094 RepID=A0ABR9SAT8_9BURK|nr:MULTISPECIES: ProQ/FINO family protein [Ramlibacter]MBE7939458.1 prop effector [Ramlibacter aquaticus]